MHYKKLKPPCVYQQQPLLSLGPGQHSTSVQMGVVRYGMLISNSLIAYTVHPYPRPMGGRAGKFNKRASTETYSLCR